MIRNIIQHRLYVLFMVFLTGSIIGQVNIDKSIFNELHIQMKDNGTDIFNKRISHSSGASNSYTNSNNMNYSYNPIHNKEKNTRNYSGSSQQSHDISLNKNSKNSNYTSEVGTSIVAYNLNTSEHKNLITPSTIVVGNECVGEEFASGANEDNPGAYNDATLKGDVIILLANVILYASIFIYQRRKKLKLKVINDSIIPVTQ